MHAVEHLINPLALQHDPTTASAATATVLPTVSTPPPFQVLHGPITDILTLTVSSPLCCTYIQAHVNSSVLEYNVLHSCIKVKFHRKCIFDLPEYFRGTYFNYHEVWTDLHITANLHTLFNMAEITKSNIFVTV